MQQNSPFFDRKVYVIQRYNALFSNSVDFAQFFRFV